MHACRGLPSAVGCRLSSSNQGNQGNQGNVTQAGHSSRILGARSCVVFLPPPVSPERPPRCPCQLEAISHGALRVRRGSGVASLVVLEGSPRRPWPAHARCGPTPPLWLLAPPREKRNA